MPDHCPTSLGAGPDGCGEYHAAALELAAETDALLHDSQLLTPAELAAEARFGHAAADYAVELGRRARARKVLLAHHRPDRTDDALDELKERFAETSGVERDRRRAGRRAAIVSMARARDLPRDGQAEPALADECKRHTDGRTGRGRRRLRSQRSCGRPHACACWTCRARLRGCEHAWRRLPHRGADASRLCSRRLLDGSPAARRLSLLHREATCRALAEDSGDRFRPPARRRPSRRRLRLGRADRDDARRRRARLPPHLRKLVKDTDAIVPSVLAPLLSPPAHPLAMARFGLLGLWPTTVLARPFKTDQGRALLAGLGAHSMRPLGAPGTGAFALLLGVLAHAVGWPVVRRRQRAHRRGDGRRASEPRRSSAQRPLDHRPAGASASAEHAAGPRASQPARACRAAPARALRQSHASLQIRAGHLQDGLGAGWARALAGRGLP